MIKNVNFNVRRGEVVGIAGLMGAGPHRVRHEPVRPLLWPQHHRPGAARTASEIDVCTIVAGASTHGLAYVTEDRKSYGLILTDDIRKNITLANLDGVAPARRDRRHRASCRSPTTTASQHAHPLLRRLPGDRSTSPAATSRRWCCAKWLFADPEVLILDEPTRGIDVGAKYEIYTHHQRAGGRRARRRGDLLGDARAARHLRPHLRHERRRASSASCRRRSEPGKDHARHHANERSSGDDAPRPRRCDDRSHDRSRSLPRSAGTAASSRTICATTACCCR